MNKFKKWISIFFNSPIVPFLLFVVLVVAGAFSHSLWGDEAENALFARNLLRFGNLKGWDGVNIMGLEDAVYLNKDLVNHMSPPAQFYITASSFALFGESSFTARLPFIIFSVLSVLIFYNTSLIITKNRRTSVLSLWIISLSIAFILMSYQSRYYSVTIFAGLLMCRSLFLFNNKSVLPKILFIFGSVLFFYAHYVSFIAFYSALVLSFIMYLLLMNRPHQEIKYILKYILLLTAVIVVFCLPWYIAQNPLEGRGSFTNPFGQSLLEYYRIYVYMTETFLAVNYINVFPVVPLILVLIIFLFKKKKYMNYSLLFLILLPFLFYVFLGIFSITTHSHINFYALRYTTVIFPFYFLLIGSLINELWIWRKTVALVSFSIFICTNLFTLHYPRSFLIEYIHEVIKQYKTSDDFVADYLKKHAKKGESVFISLSRAHEVLIFHLGSSLRFVNRVTPNNPRIFPENKTVLPQYIYSFHEHPDWIVLYGTDSKVTFWNFDRRQLPNSIDLEKAYKKVAVLPVFYGSDVARPEITIRSFHEIKPKDNEKVFIYKKRK